MRPSQHGVRGTILRASGAASASPRTAPDRRLAADRGSHLAGSPPTGARPARASRFRSLSVAPAYVRNTALRRRVPSSRFRHPSLFYGFGTSPASASAPQCNTRINSSADTAWRSPGSRAAALKPDRCCRKLCAARLASQAEAEERAVSPNDLTLSNSVKLTGPFLVSGYRHLLYVHCDA